MSIKVDKILVGYILENLIYVHWHKMSEGISDFLKCLQDLYNGLEDVGDVKCGTWA